MAKKYGVPWTGIVSGLVGLLAIFGTVAAYGKQQAKNEQVEKDVDDLEEQVEEQQKQLTEADKNYSLVQQDMGTVKETMKQILEEVKRRK